MTNNISNELIYETLKTAQAHVSRIPKIEADLADLQALVRDSFISLKTHLHATHADQLGLEQRMLSLESSVLRIRREMELTDHAP